MGRLKLYYILKRVRLYMQKKEHTEAYEILLKAMDELEEDLLYRDAKRDWHLMNMSIQNDEK